MQSSMKQLLDAVLSREDADVKRLLRTVPNVVRARFEQDYLVEAIPHWLYVGDTALLPGRSSSELLRRVSGGLKLAVGFNPRLKSAAALRRRD